MKPAHLALAIGATARLTRLVTRDTITRGGNDPLGKRVLYNRDQRAALAAGQPVPPPERPRAAAARLWLLTLINCDWCASLWIAAPVAGLATLAHRHHRDTWFTVPATALTSSYAAGWLASHDGH